MVKQFVRSQLRKFLSCTAKAHEIRLDELKQNVKEIHESVLQDSALKEVRERVESLMQELKILASVALEEKCAVSELIGSHSANDFFGCQPIPFMEAYGPKITSLQNMCRQNDKTLKGLETGLLLFFNHEDPLLTEVQSLLTRSRKLSKSGAQSFTHFSRYNSRFKIESSWLSGFPKTLEACSESFSVITEKILDLQKAVLQKSRDIDDLVSCKHCSQSFKSNFSDLHTLKRTLDAIDRMVEGSAALKREIADVSSQFKDLASIYNEKRIIAVRFASCEQLVKRNISMLESPLSKLHVEVVKAKKLYDDKFRRLPKDALVPEINIHVYKQAEGHSDFSWRVRKFNNRYIYPPVRTQGTGQCAYASTITCTEFLYKIKCAALNADEFTKKLSIEHLQDLVSSFLETGSREGWNTLDYSLESMEVHGVVTEDDYEHGKDNLNGFQRYRVKEFEKLNISNVEEVNEIIEKGTALIGNIKITTDYHRLGPNDIYDIPDGAVFETNIAGTTCSHCVVIIGFGVTPGGLAYYVFQNSYGPLWGIDGCGRVVSTCLRHLYRAKV